jgi:hypothetical protein
VTGARLDGFDRFGGADGFDGADAAHDRSLMRKR